MPMRTRPPDGMFCPAVIALDWTRRVSQARHVRRRRRARHAPQVQHRQSARRDLRMVDARMRGHDDPPFKRGSHTATSHAPDRPPAMACPTVPILMWCNASTPMNPYDALDRPDFVDCSHIALVFGSYRRDSRGDFQATSPTMATLNAQFSHRPPAHLARSPVQCTSCPGGATHLRAVVVAQPARRSSPRTPCARSRPGPAGARPPPGRQSRPV